MGKAFQCDDCRVVFVGEPTRLMEEEWLKDGAKVVVAWDFGSLELCPKCAERVKTSLIYMMLERYAKNGGSGKKAVAVTIDVPIPITEIKSKREHLDRVNTKEAARILEVSLLQVQRWLRMGILIGRRRGRGGRGQWQMLRSDVEAFKHKQSPDYQTEG